MILAITVTIENVPMIHRVMMKVNDGDDSYCDPGLFFRIFLLMMKTMIMMINVTTIWHTHSIFCDFYCDIYS